MRIETTEQKCARLEVENAAQAARIKLLEQKLDAVIKLLYGAKSEKIDPAQLQLLLEGLEPKKPLASSGETSAPEGAGAAKSAANKNRNHSRIKGLDDLETVEETIYPEAYLANPEAYELIGREVTEQLDYRPGRCHRPLTIRPKFKLKADRNQPPILAPAPAGPLALRPAHLRADKRTHPQQIRLSSPALPPGGNVQTGRHRHPP